MENTSCGQNCPFVKQGFCYSEKECPHYIESWWTNGENQQQKLVKDCATKRLLIQQQQMENRLCGVQASLEQSRNEYNQLCTYLKSLIEISKSVIVTECQKNLKTLDKENEKTLPYIPIN